MQNLFQPLSDDVAVYLWWLMALAVAVVAAKTVRKRRFMRQVMANWQAQCSLDGDYHVFRNLEFHYRGKPEQADYVYVSRYGVFLVSAPAYQGKIWGDDGSGYWKHRFYQTESLFPNPLLRNQRHIQALSEKLSVSPRRFYSVVVFEKHCRFQTMMPDNVVDIDDFQEFVRQYDEAVLDDEEVKRIRIVLETSEFDAVFGDRRDMGARIPYSKAA